MCTHITAVVTTDLPSAEVERRIAAIGRQFESHPESPFLKGLPGRKAFLHDTGSCDCGTVVGRGHRPEHAKAVVDEEEKIRKRGWSEEKIRRWRLAREQAIIRSVERSNRGAEIQLLSWVRDLSALLSDPDVASVGLIHHFYDEALDDPNLRLSAVERVTLPEFAPSLLWRLPPDTLLEVVEVARGRAGKTARRR